MRHDILIETESVKWPFENNCISWNWTKNKLNAHWKIDDRRPAMIDQKKKFIEISLQIIALKLIRNSFRSTRKKILWTFNRFRLLRNQGHNFRIGHASLSNKLHFSSESKAGVKSSFSQWTLSQFRTSFFGTHVDLNDLGVSDSILLCYCECFLASVYF